MQLAVAATLAACSSQRSGLEMESVTATLVDNAQVGRRMGYLTGATAAPPRKQLAVAATLAACSSQRSGLETESVTATAVDNAQVGRRMGYLTGATAAPKPPWGLLLSTRKRLTLLTDLPSWVLAHCFTEPQPTTSRNKTKQSTSNSKASPVHTRRARGTKTYFSYRGQRGHMATTCAVRHLWSHHFEPFSGGPAPTFH